MSELTTSTTKLFRSLKPQSGDSRVALEAAAKGAEQRWPLLKSSQPKKWLLAPALSDSQKQERRTLVDANPAPTAAIKEIKQSDQLAVGLTRMAARKPLLIATREPAATPVAATLVASRDDSIEAVLSRLAQAQKSTAQPSAKLPGFLSRLLRR